LPLISTRWSRSPSETVRTAVLIWVRPRDTIRPIHTAPATAISSASPVTTTTVVRTDA
jgi:hypothetical protein